MTQPATRKRTRYRNKLVTIRADRLRDDLVIHLVPGSQPYIWIGQRDADGREHYLGSVTVRAVLGAVERSKIR